jgi:FkbM family methyltransferase
MEYVDNFKIENKYNIKSNAQLNQDIWVLEKNHNKQHGYYIDIGCADGEEISNTYLLDKSGWNGLCIDLLARNMKNRTCKIHKGLVYDTEKDVEFVKADFNSDFSGIKSNITKFKEHLTTSPVETHKTQITQSVLNNYNVPTFVDFLSIDVEGSELHILKGIDFNKHVFGIIMIEHNFQQPLRDEIRSFLKEKRYKYETSNQWDDVYVYNMF